jgi:hypothetical protein
MLEAVRGRPPPLAVIRGAVGGVWLVFEEVYEVKSKKRQKLLKKKVVKIFFRTRILEVGEDRQIFWPPPPFEISKYATGRLFSKIFFVLHSNVERLILQHNPDP